jgi:photosystem II stability/assembly factor-like uncharacterized protein
MRLLRVIGMLTVPILAVWIVSLRGQPRGILSNPVAVVQVDPHYQGTLLAGTATAILFRTRDAANSWRQLLFPAALHATLHALLIDPVNPHTYFVALSSETPLYAGVFRSLDDGVTWEQVSDLSRKQVWSLAFWPVDGRVMAAGAQDGVYISRDGGQTWAHSAGQSIGPQPVVSLAFDATNSDTLYAGTPHLVWKTTDGSKTWRLIHRGMEEDSDIFSIAVDSFDPRNLLAGTCGGIYKSRNGGVTWANLGKAVGAQSRTYVVARPPRSSSVIFAGTSEGLLQSPNAGTTWHWLSRHAAWSIAFDSDKPGRMYVASDIGILRSDDGGSHFTEANQGIHDNSLASAVR